ncbi:MAG TPA: UDP-N-acetylmuramoyl-tripeptide--D-alanyl-D-alanine ligase [Gemmatimonadales bacterium]|nr:UDP-N-acetylmuramoyl-tripeptide--D-alanyl-D-alanine ligase [Gemmatimonadales bacterium]
MSWSSQFVAEALGVPVPAGEFSEISTDTRTLRPAALFVALVGERFDGHDHLERARDAGATGAVVRKGTRPVEGLQLLGVDDTLGAYGRLARARRREISGPVVAVTGSNGKTSTKEMVAAVLRTRFSVHATRLNLNNLVGIPQTILAAPPDSDALVIEAGASTPGEIARAREIIEPTVAIVTNVGDSHLEGFGSRNGVMLEKLALLTDVPLGIVGTDPPDLGRQARSRARRVLTGGLKDCDVTPTALTLDGSGRPRFTVDGVEVLLPIRGQHQAGNAMLAWALVRELGLDRQQAADALSALTLPGGRGEVLEVGGLTIMNDAYNANPASFRTAIATAQAMRQGRRLVFIAGSMRELGKDTKRFHHEIAGELAALNPDILGVVGDFVPAIQPHTEVLGSRLIRASDPIALGPLLKERLQGNELVVLKASRGVQLERILPFLGVTIEPH